MHRLAAIASIAYPLNFAWEYLHYPLYVCAMSRWPCALLAALGDVVIILGIYAVGAALFGGWPWIDGWSARKVAFVLGSGLLMAAVIEVKALMLGQWSYVSSMPLIFGLGLSPLIQMLILPLVTLVLASVALGALGDRTRASSRSSRR